MNVIKFEDLNFSKFDRLMLFLFRRQYTSIILDKIRKELNQLE